MGVASEATSSPKRRRTASLGSVPTVQLSVADSSSARNSSACELLLRTGPADPTAARSLPVAGCDAIVKQHAAITIALRLPIFGSCSLPVGGGQSHTVIYS